MALLKAGNLAPVSVEGPAEMREIAHAFNQLIVQLQHRRESQLRFLAGIAHDLRTPLNAMKLSTTLMDGDNLFAEQRETVQTIDRQISARMTAARRDETVRGYGRRKSLFA